MRAAATVAHDVGLPRDWVNTEIAAQWRTGLPPGLTGDVDWRHFGETPGNPETGLFLGLVGQQALITLKLFAATDRGPRSVHFQDLVALRPSASDLERAATWVRTQDANPDFASLVDQVIAHVLSYR